MVMNKVQADAFADFVNSDPDDSKAREEAYGRMRGLTAVLDGMDSFINDGLKVSRETPQDPAETGPKGND